MDKNVRRALANVAWEESDAIEAELDKIAEFEGYIERLRLSVEQRRARLASLEAALEEAGDE